jgi:hypothetical protein
MNIFQSSITFTFSSLKASLQANFAHKILLYCLDLFTISTLSLNYHYLEKSF